MERIQNQIETGRAAAEFYAQVKERLGKIEADCPALTLISLDFNNFNYVNDLFGYETGDLALERIAHHFGTVMQGEDIFCRVHADHFLFCLSTGDQTLASQTFLRLTNLKEALAEILPPHYTLVASGGILVLRGRSSDLSALLDQVNYARKKAKGGSVHTYQVYDERMSTDVQWRKQVTLMMEAALKHREFEMYLQPKLLFKTGAIMGAEALVRWKSPTFGLIAPDRFIPIMEQNGFVRQLDFFMLEEACRFICRSHELGLPRLPISVNFSKTHVQTENLVEKIAQTAYRGGVPPYLIEIEFTESMFSENIETLIGIVSGLKRLGFLVSIDDFGNAYSSLSYLKDLPIDIVKIDKEFLNATANSDRGRMVIAKVVELVKSLHMLSVMEGVETAEQVAFLQHLNCDIGQGYFYARPMPEHEFNDYLAGGVVMDALPGPNAPNIPLPRRETAEEQAREALRISEERYRLVVEQSDDIMFEWDFETDSFTFSDKFEALFERIPTTEGVSTETGACRYVHPEDLPAYHEWVAATYRKPGRSTGSFRIRDGHGRYLWMTCRSTAICDQAGTPIRAVGVYSNVSAQKQLLDDLRHRAQIDPLTRLLNKEEFQRQIHDYLQARPAEPGLFIMVDVDDFKEINDNLGHQTGDSVLKEIAGKIRELFSETGMIGRIGGDEFAIYLPAVDQAKALGKLEQLNQRLRIAYFGSSSKYEISGSMGIARYPADGKTFEELYRYADIALYDAKNKGKDRYVLYSSEIASTLMDSRTPVEYAGNFLSTYFQDDLTYNVFEMLYETKDVAASVQMILEILGKKYGVDRVYIFESIEGGAYIRNTYEWCAPNITAEKEQLSRVPSAVLEAYYKQYSAEGVFCCADITETLPEVYEICAPQGIKSLLHCAIYNEGQMIGFIGFDVCTACHRWTGAEIAMLGYISRILSVFMMKSTTTNELHTSYANYARMIDNLNGFVYVIDEQTFEVLFVNRAIQELGLVAGSRCYKMAFGMEEQCAACPIRKMTAQAPYAHSKVWSEILKGWVNSAASRMKWEGNRDAILVCCTEVV